MYSPLYLHFNFKNGLLQALNTCYSKAHAIVSPASTRQVSQPQVTSKDCPGFRCGRGEEKAEAGQGMDTHLEAINSSPRVEQAKCPITDRPETFKTPD